MRTENKTILITGASSGVGEEITRLTIKEGWNVIGIARNFQKLQELKEELGDAFRPIECDVADLNRVMEISIQLKQENIYPSIFFLNAGIAEIELKGIEQESQKRTFATNYFGVINWLEIWLNDCLMKKTIFVCMSSPLVICPLPKMSGYCASKAALKSSFESLRVQYADSKISFLTVFPGAMNTGIIQNRMKKKILFLDSPKQAAEKIFRRILKVEEEIYLAPIRRILLIALSLFSKKIIKKFYNRIFL